LRRPMAMLLALALVLGGLWASTQSLAHSLRYPPALGPPWFSLFHPIYKPYQVLEWTLRFPQIPNRLIWPSMLYTFAGLALALTLKILLRKDSTADETAFGTSTWATKKQIRGTGLLEDRGVFLGRLSNNGRYLRHDGPEHILAFAPTRTGKGVGLVIPSLLAWPDSVIVHDVKGENWQRTAGIRSSFSRCLYFNPVNPDSARFNPLAEVRDNELAVRDAQNIADILVDPTGDKKPKDHWEETAHNLLTAAILHVVFEEKHKTLAEVTRFLSTPGRDLDETLEIMGRADPGPYPCGKTHAVVVSIAQEMLNKSPNELSGVFSTALRFLRIYRDPLIERATSRSDFRLADLIKGEQPVSLYLATPPSDSSRTMPVMRLILNQMGRVFTEEAVDSAPNRRVLFMLDEFPALGRLQFFETSLAFLAGYGIKCFLIAQSLNQLENIYGANNAIMDNCHVRVTFAANDERTAKRISDLLGTKTQVRKITGYSGARWGFLNHRNLSTRESARPLLTPGEVMQLPQDEELIFVAGCPPIRARKILYYKEKPFLPYLLPAPEVGSLPEPEPVVPPPKEPEENAPAGLQPLELQRVPIQIEREEEKEMALELEELA
jgi:type IV secretion system protein VirD4